MTSLDALSPRDPALAALRAALAGPLSHAAADGAGRDWVPPELAVFGRGRGEALFGVVLPAPELPGAGHLVAEYGPDGVVDGLFRSTREGAAAFARQHARGPEAQAAAARVAAAPDLRVAPPADHLALDAADGLPLWVPRWSWRESDVGALSHPAEVPRRMRDLVAAGRPGSALHLGRYMEHALRRYPAQGALRDEVWEALALAYAALGRPAYAGIARARAGGGEALVPSTREPGEVPADALAGLIPLVARDVIGFAGLRRARVSAAAGELVVLVDVAVDPTRHPDAADRAGVRLSQAWEGGATRGPVRREILHYGRAIPKGLPPPDPRDDEAVRAIARGWLDAGGPVGLEDRAGDLGPLGGWR